MELVVKLIPAFITLIIGSIAAYIALQQHKVNHDRLRLDLFDKRVKVYDRLIEALRIIVDHGDRDQRRNEIRNLLLDSLNESKFLFGEDINDYCRDIWKKYSELKKLDRKIFGKNSPEPGIEREMLCDDLEKVEEWLDDQISEASNTFSRYLKFEPLDFWSDLRLYLESEKTKNRIL